jgi:hypothetical protein
MDPRHDIFCCIAEHLLNPAMTNAAPSVTGCIELLSVLLSSIKPG